MVVVIFFILYVNVMRITIKKKKEAEDELDPPEMIGKTRVFCFQRDQLRHSGLFVLNFEQGFQGGSLTLLWCLD